MERQQGNRKMETNKLTNKRKKERKKERKKGGN